MRGIIRGYKNISDGDDVIAECIDLIGVYIQLNWTLQGAWHVYTYA